MAQGLTKPEQVSGVSMEGKPRPPKRALEINLIGENMMRGSEEIRCDAAPKASVARRTLDYAASIADRLEDTANRASGKLNPIMRQKFPVTCEEKNADEQWPDLFEQLRKELRRIEEAQRHIDQTIDLVEL